MSFQVGRSYGNYEIIDVLHSSREGVTYKVRNTLCNRLEAMKVLPWYAQNDQEALERFYREIRVHAGMVHPNIISFYNAAELENRLVMTFELVEGVTLAERLELGPLRLTDALTYMGHVLSALAYAHERCIVHRDLNPSRIVLTPGGPARLNGFSLAKGVTESNLTMIGSVVGSLGYISPEQIKGIDRLDGRSDIYSVGAVLYEVLTGRPPFQAKSQFDLMSAHVNAIPAPPSTIQRSIPQEVDAAVLKALAKDPADRYQTATNFRQVLESLVSSHSATTIRQPVAAPPPPPPLSMPAMAAPPPLEPAGSVALPEQGLATKPEPVEEVVEAEPVVVQPSTEPASMPERIAATAVI